jgi:hypothetical protein
VIPHAEFKLGFFDRDKVVKAMDKETRRVLSRFGAFVRQRDRTSQKRRKGISGPGSPPSAHVGLIRDKTFFAYEPVAKSVVIGPAFLNKPNRDALRLVEEGGDTLRVIKGKARRLHYQARPHTGPAFQAELSKLPGLWARG